MLELDALLFYLNLRNSVQAKYGLCFKLKAKLLDPSSTRKFHADGAVALRLNSILRDGSEEVFLAKDSCHSLLVPIAGTVQLASYLVEECLTTAFHSFVTTSGHTKTLLKSQMHQKQNMISATVFFSSILAQYLDTPRDIVAKYKYNDSGTF